ncbi:prepilin peptidase [Vibrio sp. Sgm 22]|uniref:A24 family peptidase n=1 Tax=unclassified Vibrio TaxID=2614977 RepID=UPI002248DCB7|nr:MULTISPECIES: prepilin peptidase [unclassified Vibrio]MCX2758859.1 prepilin peptidase [Vibrio sp. 14G-20]MCX2775959.1 prepilin peptidase [Vibrio sp. Sgm 22]
MVDFFLSSLLFQCLYISYIDVTSRTITNFQLLLLIFVHLFIFMSFHWDVLTYSILIVLCSGWVIYTLGLLGAGDIKYAAVLSLSLPMDLLSQALLLTTLTGGVLAFIYLLLHLVRRVKANLYKGMEEVQYNPGIPYGVAISVGFYVMIFSHWVNYL